MAFSTTTTIQPLKPITEKPVGHDYSASLLSMLVLSIYAAQKSKKTFRKMKRRFLWTTLKLKAKSLLSGRSGNVSDRTLIYILIGILILALLIVSPIVALVLVIIGLILYLAGVIKF